PATPTPPSFVAFPSHPTTSYNTSPYTTYTSFHSIYSTPTSASYLTFPHPTSIHHPNYTFLPSSTATYLISPT
uniref:hypothetical protein n=1 Tax=Kocuria salsicia TaxID=664639 RepID=UPI001C92C06F